MKDRTRILVVEDDPDRLALTSEVLSSAGYAVVEAATGKDALEAVREFRPGIVLLDVVLPDMSGLDVCKEIKADPGLRNILVVLLSGISTSSEAKAMGLDLGADGYIVKPIPNKELLARVHSFVRIKEAEEALKISETRYRRLFETAQDGILILDADTGRITDVNPYLMEMLGYSYEHLIGKKLWEIGAFEDVDASKAAFSELQSKGYVRYENLSLETKDNGQIHVEFICNGYTVDHRNVLQCNIRDITERKKAEEILRASEERYRSYIEVTCQLAWTTNADGQVVENLLSWRKFTGQTKEEMKSAGWAGALHPDDVEQTVQVWKKAVATKTAYEVEYRIRRYDGVYRHFLARAVPLAKEDGSVREWVGTCIDITERKQTEEALQQAHNELEQRVAERTAELSKANEQLKQEVERRKQTEESLLNALSEIKALKDRLEAENIYFRQEMTMKHQFSHIVGQSNALKYVLYRAEQVAPANTTVLVLGETGTGKELIAAAIHQMSLRKDRPLVIVNCAALPANLIESELFGREKGAFTGADVRRVGRFEIANGSTLCLDEIGELPLEVQGKLLRVIQHGEFQRLGSPYTVKVDVRLVATTNRNLEEEVRKGRFRKDLYYRLNVFPITVPPLRQRKEDIPMLVQTFLERFSRKLGRRITSIPKETMLALQEYEWPGNIRELENVIERAVILCQGPVFRLADQLEDLPHSSSSASKTLEEAERGHILRVLSETRWRINGEHGAAAILGLNPSTLRARMQKLGIRRPSTPS